MKSILNGNFSTIKYKLSDKTLNNISKTTKLSKEELTNLSLDKQIKLMQQRGTIKKPNPIRTFLADKYIKLGQKLGFIKKDYNIYTHD